ncbi:MAG: carbon-nitrogen hydrolase family protein [Chloroflexi bacterium]|nr:carbon-nitrogen hydrolase family protein [Chloroflexota bacterium]
MSREITIALVQMAPVLNEPLENVRRMGDMIERICTQEKVQVVVFPELITTGYECGLRFADLAERVPGPSINVLAKDAADFNIYLVFGMVTKAKVETVLYDSVVILGPDGDLVGVYNKVHLRGEERIIFRSGYRFPVFETEFGTLGVLAGWDQAFPEAARSLVLDGAELILVSAAWDADLEGMWPVLNQARAAENSVFVAAANRVGEEPSYRFSGGSLVVGPYGEVHTALDGGAEGYALATVDLDEVREVRERLQLIQHREPTAYRALVRKY